MTLGTCITGQKCIHMSWSCGHHCQKNNELRYHNYLGYLDHRELHRFQIQSLNHMWYSHPLCLPLCRSLLLQIWDGLALYLHWNLTGKKSMFSTQVWRWWTKKLFDKWRWQQQKEYYDLSHHNIWVFYLVRFHLEAKCVVCFLLNSGTRLGSFFFLFKILVVQMLERKCFFRSI